MPLLLTQFPIESGSYCETSSTIHELKLVAGTDAVVHSMVAKHPEKISSSPRHSLRLLCLDITLQVNAAVSYRDFENQNRCAERRASTALTLRTSFAHSAGTDARSSAEVSCCGRRSGEGKMRTASSRKRDVQWRTRNDGLVIKP